LLDLAAVQLNTIGERKAGDRLTFRVLNLAAQPTDGGSGKVAHGSVAAA
jgi:hypothetical protein